MEMFFKILILFAFVHWILDTSTACNPPKTNFHTYKYCTPENCLGKSACVNIFQHRGFHGYHQCLTFEQNACIKFDYWWDDGRVSSVNTYQTCVRLYENHDCSGAALEIQPSDSSQNNLFSLDFEDIAKSASSCGRSFDQKECYVKSIFYENTNRTTSLANASKNVLVTIDKVADLVISSISIVIPGINQFYMGIKIIANMFKQDDSTEALIDEKIKIALGENALRQISAKIAVVEKKVKSVLSKRSNLRLQRIEISLALHTCEEIYELFLDKEYSLRKNVLMSSPHFVGFSSVYFAVAKIAHKLLPSKRLELENDMEKLCELIKKFTEAAIEERNNRFSLIIFNGDMPYYLLRDRDFFGNKVLVKSCRDNGCSVCLDMIKASIKIEIEQFFKVLVEKLGQFP